MHDINHMLEREQELTAIITDIDNFPGSYVLSIGGQGLQYRAYLSLAQINQINEAIQTFLADQLDEVLA
jgi:hypothetical protein